MQITPTLLFGLALAAYALTRVPDKYRPAWTHRLNSWQALIGVVAVVMAVLIVMNPEFYVLGILGDSAFFDLLVLAIGLELQMVMSRVGRFVAARVTRARWEISMESSLVAWGFVSLFAASVSSIQKVVPRLTS